jgi:RNA polymerase sigma factor (sigma-70 family)
MIDFNAVPDEDLYGMCKAGDEDAWQYLYNYILAICKWNKWDLRDDPDELAQNITMHFIEKAIKKVKEKNKFRNFVKITSINKIKDSFKAISMKSLDEPVRGNKGEDFVPDHPDPKPLHDTSLLNIEIVSIIDSAIKKLANDCQRVVREYLKFKIGVYEDYKELSKVLKMPVPTISSSVRRCLNKLIEFKEIKALKA